VNTHEKQLDANEVHEYRDDIYRQFVFRIEDEIIKSIEKTTGLTMKQLAVYYREKRIAADIYTENVTGSNPVRVARGMLYPSTANQREKKRAPPSALFIIRRRPTAVELRFKGAL
jgi:hypothetical protein